MKNKKIMIILTLLMAIVCLTEKTYAKTINITSQQYSVYRAEVPLGGNETWTNYVSNGTQTTNNTDNYIILGFRTKFYSSGKYEANTQYQAKVRANTTPKMTYTNAQPNIEFSCYGSTSNSNYNPQQSLVSSCQLVSVVIEEGNNFTDYIINFTPSTQIETIQFVILFDAKYNMTRINIDNTSTITTDTTTQDAINNQTTNIINNQNENTQQQIESQRVCKQYDRNTIKELGAFSSDGVIQYNTTRGITDYINIEKAEVKLLTKTYSFLGYYCFYNTNKTLINCIASQNTELGNITIPNNAIYMRATILIEENKPTFEVCQDGNQAINNTLNQDHEYNNNPSQDTTSQENQMNNFEQEEDNLRNSLDLNIEDSEITINPYASSFIWDTINRLREMSGKIVLLFTSVLSLGIMKMILGR